MTNQPENHVIARDEIIDCLDEIATLRDEVYIDGDVEFGDPMAGKGEYVAVDFRRDFPRRFTRIDRLLFKLRLGYRISEPGK
jgi:hypothetical protein